jgi:predicted site-specific integrase-resolvase
MLNTKHVTETSRTSPVDELVALLTPAALARRLATTPQTILRWEKAGVIPAKIKAGRIVRFEFEAVAAALQPGKEGK